MFNPERWNFFNQSSFTIGDKTYRNLEAQVQKNKEDIEELDLETLNGLPERVDDLEDYTEAIGDDVAALVDEMPTKQNKVIKHDIVLRSALWTSNHYIATVDGLDPNDVIFVSPTEDDYDAYTQAGIRCEGSSSGILNFICDNTPTENINVNCAILEV